MIPFRIHRFTWLAALPCCTAALAAPPKPDVERPIEVVRSSADRGAIEAATRFALGKLRQSQDRLVQAQQEFRIALEKEPNAIAPKRELAKLAALLGREATAIRLAEDVLKAEPSDVDAAKLLGRLYMDGKQPAEAFRAYARVLKSSAKFDPLSRWAMLKDAGAAAAEANLHAEAEVTALERIDLISANRELWAKEGLFSQRDLDRERAKLYESLGQAQLAQRKFLLASAAFDTASSIFADAKQANDSAGAARVHEYRSRSLQAQGEPREAMRELEKYLAFGPREFAPYERFAELSKALERNVPADLERVAGANPKNPAPKWIAAAIELASDPDAGDKKLRQLQPKLANADEARTFVAAYARNKKPDLLLLRLDDLFKSARPKGFDDFDRDREVDLDDAAPAAVERARLVSVAVQALPTASVREMLLQVGKDVGDPGRKPKHHSDTYELLLGLAERHGLVAGFTAPLQSAAMLQPKDVRLKWLAVQALSSQRKWRELLSVAESLSKSDNGRYFVDIKAQEAIAHAELNDASSAMAALKELGDTPYTQSYRIRILNMLNRPAEALRVCEKALEIATITDYQSYLIQRFQADTLNILGKHAEAEKVLRRLLDDHPDDPILLNNLGYQLADQGRKLDEAEAFIRRAIALDRDDRRRAGDPEREAGGYLDSLGWTEFKRGRFREARALLKKATESPESAPDAIVWDHYGDACYRLDDRAAARDAWKEAAKRYEDSHIGRQKSRLDEVKAKLKLVE